MKKKLSDLSSKIEFIDVPCGNCNQVMKSVRIISVFFTHDNSFKIEDLENNKRNRRICEHCGHDALYHSPFLIVDSLKFASCFFSSKKYSIIENFESKRTLLEWVYVQLKDEELFKLKSKNDESLNDQDVGVLSWSTLPEDVIGKRSQGLANYIEAERYPVLQQILALMHNQLDNIDFIFMESEFNSYFQDGLQYFLDNFEKLLEYDEKHKADIKGALATTVEVYILGLILFKKDALNNFHQENITSWKERVLKQGKGNSSFCELKFILKTLSEVISKHSNLKPTETVLHNLLEHAKTKNDASDELQVIALIIDFYLENNEALLALSYSEKLARISFVENNIKYQALSCFGIGRAEKMRNNYENALANFRFSAKLATKSKDALVIGCTMKELSIAEGNDGGFEFSIRYINTAIRAFELHDDWKDRVVDCLILAIGFFIRLEDKEHAQISANKALEISTTIDNYRKDEIVKTIRYIVHDVDTDEEYGSYDDTDLLSYTINQTTESLIRRFDNSESSLEKIEELVHLIYHLGKSNDQDYTFKKFYKNKLASEIYKGRLELSLYGLLFAADGLFHSCSPSFGGGKEDVKLIKLALSLVKSVIEDKRSLSDSYITIRAFFNFARYSEQLGNIEDALEYYTKAIYIFERIRVTLLSTKYKKNYQEEFNAIFHRAIRSILMLYDFEEIKLNFELLNKIFLYSELSKARLINDKFESNNSSYFSNNVLPLSEIKKSISNRSAILHLTMIPNNPDINFKGFWLGLLVTQEDINIFQFPLESTYQLINNYIMQLDKTLYKIQSTALQTDKATSINIALSELNSKRKKIRETILPNELMKLLKKQGINLLQIVPEYYLYNLPWTSLTFNPADLSIGENVSVSLCPSANALYNSINVIAQPESEEPNLLFFSGGSKDLDSMSQILDAYIDTLPAVKANKIHHVYGLESTKERFLEQAKNADIIIYYGHTLWGGDQLVQQSGITFIEEKGQIVCLTIEEINNLTTIADKIDQREYSSIEQFHEVKSKSNPFSRCKLFFIGSCFGGKAVTENSHLKEVESVSMSLLAAGVNCVIGSHYPVTTKVISVIVANFLNEIFNDATISDSLKTAISHLLVENKNSYLSDPIFWSNLIIYGNSKLSFGKL